MKKKALSWTILLTILLVMICPWNTATESVQAKPLPLTGFSLHKSELRLDLYKTARLNIINVLPYPESLVGDVTWSSSNTAVVVMTNHPTAPNQFKAVGKGYALVTAKIGAVSASCMVIVGDDVVVPTQLASFSLSSAQMTIPRGREIELSLTNIVPGNAFIGNKKWFISNPSVLEPLNGEGEFVAKAAGYTTVTCQIGSAKAYCKIYVTQPETPPNPSLDDLEMVRVWDRMLDVIDQNHIYEKMKLFDENYLVDENNPLSESPYMPPINSIESYNKNTWRAPGALWEDTNYEAYINLMADWQLYHIFFFDGQVYAPSTYTEDGSAPYEVMGGTFKIYVDDQLIYSYDLTNEGKWVHVDLTELISEIGIPARKITFAKEQDTSMDGGFRYSWATSNRDWISPSKEYICDVNIVEVAMYGIQLSEGGFIEYPM